MTIFADFFERWEEQHRRYLDKLQANQNQNQNENELVQQVLCHYQEYYDEKAKAAETDVFLMFSPPWFSSYERTLLWATGFKPSLTFQLLKESVGGDLNEEQWERIAVVALVGVMRNADDLRQQTGLRVLEVLSPGQKVKFLAGTSHFWLQSRRLGMERDRHLNLPLSF
ncbi:hypothetical protein L1987_70034 [Smallanthus sonchifolius]|uniref:Uncharacterized protein n=2 Tax=Smallanthus sonchifolius TaxID=185202 RepID=A0ACB9B738_9ASTR|nr:hypothetical protein L1987_70033 [Smallanthus sonchifolius]KAI3718042.1 hypothetical protein L1987_70034 [Smallanthus sonchifolius]